MGLVKDIGHVILEVGDMEQAVRFYRDTLGFEVEGTVDPVWTVVKVPGGAFTLWRKNEPRPLHGDDSPFNLHVDDFAEAADALEHAGYKVHRQGEHSGYVTDPSGNVLWLHDHREKR